MIEFISLYTKRARGVKGFSSNIPRDKAKEIAFGGNAPMPDQHTKKNQCLPHAGEKRVKKAKSGQKFKISLTICRGYGTIRVTMGELYPFSNRCRTVATRYCFMSSLCEMPQLNGKES
jgi:hypothetical protein